MAADSIDARTRAVDKMKAEPGKEMAAYQAAENQLLAIQAEQKQNLAMARAQSSATVQQNNTIAQAAEVMAAGGEAAQVQQVPVNAATQGVLGKYGMGPTVSKTTTRQNQTVTKQNITINNYNTTTNNTTNNVPNTGPVQGRPVVVNRDDTGRFKVWVNNVLAKQSEQAAIRDKEFAKRESALSRSANRMTRKLESISNNLSEKLDPRRMNSSLSSSFKTVLTMMGIGLVAKNWPKLVKIFVGLEKKITNFLEYIGILGRDGRKKAGKDSPLVDNIKYLLGGKRGSGKDVSLFTVFKEFFLGDGERLGLIELIREKIKLWAENRANALKSLKFPDVSMWKPSKSIQELAKYLGNAIQILVGGPNAAVSLAATQGREDAMEETTRSWGPGGNAAAFNSSGKVIGSDGKEHKTLTSDAAIERTRTLFKSDINDRGELSDNVAASIRQSSYTADDITGQNDHRKLNILAILEGMKNIEKSIDKFDHTAVDPSLLSALEKIGVDVSDIGKTTKKFRYVNVERTDREKELDGKEKLTHRLKLVEVDDPRYPEDKYPTITEAEGYWAFGKGKIPGLSKDGTVEYPILSKEDMGKIKTRLGAVSGNEKLSFDASDLASTKSFGEFMKTKSDRAVHETYTRSIEHAAAALDAQGDYEREQKALNDKSILHDSIERTKEVIIDPLKEKAQNTMESVENAIALDPSKGLFYRKSKKDQKKDFDKNDDAGSVAGVVTQYDKEGNLVNDKGEVWDVDKAVAAIRREQKDLKSEDTGQCARWVGLAVEEGFGKTFNFRNTPLSSIGGGRWEMEAKKEGPKLEALGFTHIPNDSVPEKGDIRVFQPKDGSHAGHIAMFDGKSWYSDFKQATYHGYKDPVSNISSSALYRFGVKSKDVGGQNTEEPTGITNDEALPAPRDTEDAIDQTLENPTLLAANTNVEAETVEEASQESEPELAVQPGSVEVERVTAKVQTPTVNADWSVSPRNNETRKGLVEEVAKHSAESTNQDERIGALLDGTISSKMDKIIANQQQGNAINMTTAQAAAANVDATYSTGQATAAAASQRSQTINQEPGWTS